VFWVLKYGHFFENKIAESDTMVILGLFICKSSAEKRHTEYLDIGLFTVLLLRAVSIPNLAGPTYRRNLADVGCRFARISSCSEYWRDPNDLE
jgi:hypothetical protein